MRIVHIGDIHVYRLALAPWHLLSKRVLGQCNLWFNRRRHFKLDRLEKLVAAVSKAEPDVVLFSGDLTTTALPGEFLRAREALAPLLERFDCVIVPGNHDRYTFTAAARKRLESYFPKHTPSAYPFHRKLAPGLHLVALDPTRANVVTDRGRLGRAQLSELRKMTEAMEHTSRLIVLCHYTLNSSADHPRATHPAEKPRHRMMDAAELVDALRGARPTLYLHGHVHEPGCVKVETAPNITALNAGAPLLAGQGFWRIDITEDDWRTSYEVVA